jgi:DNA-binding MarR family transcriptional regulator
MALTKIGDAMSRPDSPPAADVMRKAEIVRLLMETGDTAREIIATTLRENGAPPSASDTMWVLVTADAPMTLRDIAAKLGRDPSTVTLAVDKLETAGIVTRVPHPTDGRKRTLSITPAGLDLWEALRDSLHSSSMFADLDADEQQTLVELLRRLG